MTGKRLQAALLYLKLGFSVIPVGRDKKPLIKWEGHQKQKATEYEITAWFKMWPDANVGLVTGKVSGLAVIDLDEPEKAKQALNELIPDSLIFPVSQTPSGGEHWFFQCDDPHIRNNARVIPGADLRAEGGYVVAPPSVNGNGRGYTWRQGLKITEVALPSLPHAYLCELQKRASNKITSLQNIKNNNSYIGSVSPPVTLSFDEGSRDETLFHVANCLVKGGMPEAEIAQTLARVGSTCNPPFPENEIQTKILSAIKRQEHRDFEISEVVKGFVSVSDGIFSVSEAYQSVTDRIKSIKEYQPYQNVSLPDRAVVRTILKRMKDAGWIRKAGTKDGVYQRVDEIAEEIDWVNASTEPLPIKFPLEVERYAAIYPKNIIVIAGEPNAGKTAFMMNLAIMNAGSHKVSYFSSEMGAIELKTRISKFDIPLDRWKAIKFKERCGNFSDVIDPDGFTIIDFLEITDDFYRIAAFIKDIFNKLNKGICVIGIQKNKGRDTGRGGELGLEKPRLYLSMEPGKIKIVKAKAWAKEGVNPNGLQCEFKLVQGAKFINSTGWHRQGEI